VETWRPTRHARKFEDSLVCPQPRFFLRALCDLCGSQPFPARINQPRSSNLQFHPGKLEAKVY